MNGATAARTTVAAGVAGILLTRLVRPWYLRWGATDEEVARPMPLDERVPSPRMASTMAITIDAPPDQVWPWIVQMGEPPRAGYYSYTWIERMVGLKIENARTILQEVQTLDVGDALDEAGMMRVLAVERDRHLVLGPPESVDSIRCTWAFGLYPTEDGKTRLITRVRAEWSYRRMFQETPLYSWPMYLMIEPGAFIMERKMLREIKRNVEAMVATPGSLTRRPFRVAGEGDHADGELHVPRASHAAVASA